MDRKRWPEWVIGAMLLVSMGCAVLALHAGNKKAEHWGPRMLELAPSGEVWLVLDQELFIASPAGKLRLRVSLAELPGPVNAIVPLPGEQARMLVGAIKLPQWLVMDGDGQVVERITPGGIDVPFYETFHLAAAPDGRIAMSTGGDHRVLLFDAKGKYLAQSDPGLFRFANGLWFEDGQWRVVDTNHGQLRFLNGASLKPEAAVAAPAVAGAQFPSLARSGHGTAGSITLSAMWNGMRHGVVYDMSSSGELLHQYRSQSENPQPMDFMWLDGQLLMADSDDFSLQLFDGKGRFLKHWGDDAIASALAAARDDRLLWSSVLTGAQTGAALLGLLALAGYFGGKRRAESVQANSPGEEFSRLGTPFLSRKDELVGTLKLFWPPILLIVGLMVLLPFLILYTAILVGIWQALFHVPASGHLVLGAVAAAFLVVTAVAAYAVQKLMLRRMQTPRFEAVLASRWVKWSQRSKALRDALEQGESVREVLMVYTTRLFPLFNRNVWVLTNRRMLLFALGTGGGGKLLEALALRKIAVRFEAGKGWFWWTAMLGEISLRRADGRVTQVYPGSPVTARRMADLLALVQGRQNGSAAHEPSVRPNARVLSPARAFLLSLLLPGAAQMMQDRFVLGLFLSTVALAGIAFSLAPVLLGWFGHYYDVPWRSGLAPVLSTSVWALLSAWDAGSYARRMSA